MKHLWFRLKKIQEKKKQQKKKQEAELGLKLASQHGGLLLFRITIQTLVVELQLPF